MFRVDIAPRGLADIEEAFVFIKAEAPARADSWLLGIIEAIHSLEDMPYRCSVAPESQAVGLEIRQLFYGKRSGVYRILFTIANDTIRVFHVRHAARRGLETDELDQLLEEDDGKP